MYVKRVYLLIPTLILATGCFKKPDQEVRAVPISVSVVPYPNGPSTSYLIATGACKGNSGIIFTYSSASTPSTTTEGSCLNDTLTLNLPVQAGLTNQVFTVLAYGKIQNKRSSPFTVTVNFNPGPKPVAGSTVNVGGGTLSSAGSSTWSVIGEYFGIPQRQTAAAMVHRSGLSGVLDP